MNTADVKRELGPGWSVRPIKVSMSNWRSRSYRLRRLAAALKMGESLVAYQQNTHEGKVVLWFASPGN